MSERWQHAMLPSEHTRQQQYSPHCGNQPPALTQVHAKRKSVLQRLDGAVHTQAAAARQRLLIACVEARWSVGGSDDVLRVLGCFAGGK